MSRGFEAQDFASVNLDLEQGHFWDRVLILDGQDHPAGGVFAFKPTRNLI